MSERRASQKGSVVVEFAILFSVLAITTLGIVSLGLIVQQSILVSYAASAGAQYGANVITNGSSTYGMQTPDVAGMQQAAQNAGQQVTGLTVSAYYWCTCTIGSTVSASCLANCSNDQALTYVSVTASTTLNNYMTFGGLLPKTFTVKNTSVMQAY